MKQVSKITSYVDISICARESLSFHSEDVLSRSGFEIESFRIICIDFKRGFSLLFERNNRIRNGSSERIKDLSLSAGNKKRVFENLNLRKSTD